MYQPVDLRQSRPMQLHEGVWSTTTLVWDALVSAATGDLDHLQQLVSATPPLRSCQYDYTSPLQLAVRSGHGEIVDWLVEQGALDPDARTHPFLDPLVTYAEDRGELAIAERLRAALKEPGRAHAWGDTGAIQRGRSDEARALETLIDRGAHDEVRTMLSAHPALAKDPDAYWGEGLLSVPANNGDHDMLALLMSYGATVPLESKWGARYYFKHTATAAWLLERGMSPEHRNWRQFRLLHDVAFTGEVDKAALLLQWGAQIDAIDDDYASTPLGYAAHWGREDMVAFLLERGANPNAAGAPWATPLAWAQRKGHGAIVERLRGAEAG